MDDIAGFWQTWRDELAKHKDTFSALHEYMVWHFGDALELKLKEQLEELHKLDPASEDYQALDKKTTAAVEYRYGRQPTVGLKLDLPDNLTLGIRPGWKKGYGDLGTVDLDVIGLELLGPGKLLCLKLSPDKISSGRLNLSMAVNKERLAVVLATAKDLLMDPMELFSRQADRCCCCHKQLTDDVSRTRGIGPECIRMFDCFKLPPPSKVAEYRHRQRQQYLADTGFLPGL